MSIDKSIEVNNKNNLLYDNRELSWLDFNSRVLEEACLNDNPVMERLKFLSITASNLDEFFMVRVAGVMAQIHSKYDKKDTSMLTPNELMEKLDIKIHSFMEKQYSCLKVLIEPVLKENNIIFLKPKKMNSTQLSYIDKYFNGVLFPVLTPLAVDVSRPLPLLANKNLYIAIRLSKDKESNFAIVQIPSVLPRFLELPFEGGRAFVLLEDIIIRHLNSLFELHEIESYCLFRITRNFDLDIDEDSDDLINAIEHSIKKRKGGRPVRLEISYNSDEIIEKFLINTFKVQKNQIYEIDGPIDLTFFMKFYDIKGFSHIKFNPMRPVDPPADFFGVTDIFEAIRKSDLMVHHPYESFSPVVEFLNQAAIDPDVLAIKQTLYRVSGNSPIIDALIEAAKNGKQVTVLFELKARFDEENNINWAKKLEKAGCHVIYGLHGLKIHCKILLVVRREESGIRRYMHIGTGNYNDITAISYTDLGLFTSNEAFGADASSLFNVLTGYSRPPKYNKMIVAPNGLRQTFEKLIKREIKHAKKGIISSITAKVNSLVDPKIISLLYEASSAGVKVELIVRGICCLIPGVPGVSDNIKVISIVGKLLEHSRIFRFQNGADPKIYIGSADFMPRNLDRRVELVIPLEDPRIFHRVDNILKLMLEDNKNARVKLKDTSYAQVSKGDDPDLDSQELFSKLAAKELEKITTIDHNKPFRPIRKKLKTEEVI